MTVFGAACFGKEAVTAYHAGESPAERNGGSSHAVQNQQIHIWKGGGYSTPCRGKPGKIILREFSAQTRQTYKKGECFYAEKSNHSEERERKRKIHKGKAACHRSLLRGIYGFSSMPVTVFAAAAGPASITQPLDNLKTIVISVIGAVGVIILAKNVMEFAQAYQQQDSSTMNSALKGVVAGIMMAGISTVLTFLGF